MYPEVPELKTDCWSMVVLGGGATIRGQELAGGS